MLLFQKYFKNAWPFWTAVGVVLFELIWKLVIVPRPFWISGVDIESDVFVNAASFAQGTGITGHWLPGTPVYFLLGIVCWFFKNPFLNANLIFGIGKLFSISFLLFSLAKFWIFISKNSESLEVKKGAMAAIALFPAVFFYLDFYCENSFLVAASILLSLEVVKIQEGIRSQNGNIREVAKFGVLCGLACTIKTIFLPFLVVGLIALLFLKADKTSVNQLKNWTLCLLLFLVLFGSVWYGIKPEPVFNKLLLIGFGLSGTIILTLIPSVRFRTLTLFGIFSFFGYLLGILPAKGRWILIFEHLGNLFFRGGMYGSGPERSWISTVKGFLYGMVPLFKMAPQWTFWVVFLGILSVATLLKNKKIVDWFLTEGLFFILILFGCLLILSSDTGFIAGGITGVNTRYLLPLAGPTAFITYYVLKKINGFVATKKIALLSFTLILLVSSSLIEDLLQRNRILGWQNKKEEIIQKEIENFVKINGRSPKILWIWESDYGPASFFLWGSNKYADGMLNDRINESYPNEFAISDLSAENFDKQVNPLNVDLVIGRIQIGDGDAELNFNSFLNLGINFKRISQAPFYSGMIRNQSRVAEVWVHERPKKN